MNKKQQLLSILVSATMSGLVFANTNANETSIMELSPTEKLISKISKSSPESLPKSLQLTVLKEKGTDFSTKIEESEERQTEEISLNIDKMIESFINYFTNTEQRPLSAQATTFGIKTDNLEKEKEILTSEIQKIQMENNELLKSIKDESLQEEINQKLSDNVKVLTEKVESLKKIQGLEQDKYTELEKAKFAQELSLTKLKVEEISQITKEHKVQIDKAKRENKKQAKENKMLTNQIQIGKVHLQTQLNEYLRKNDIKSAKTLLNSASNQMEFSFKEKRGYDILFSSIDSFKRNNPLIPDIKEVKDPQLVKYILIQGLEILPTRDSLMDFTYFIKLSGLDNDEKNRILLDLYVKIENYTLALLSSKDIKTKTTMDKVKEKNIVEMLQTIEKIYKQLIN